MLRGSGVGHASALCHLGVGVGGECEPRTMQRVPVKLRVLCI